MSAKTSSSAIDWWGERLNQFFGALTDPATFTDTSGVYVPVKHIQGITSAEQVFRRITSIQVAHRDIAPRRALFFSALDALERLTARNIETHCSLAFATKPWTDSGP
ncbi:hypothetical protein [Actinokineospora xionganensis]|uniref:Uncharacterized protein n=1 Tax=Actinokineospora xionganensis TaxID=2684470 RepID=A0ABR7LDT9_9PSEU|nr:hypothetical protein [Actinokineospora xionganensis]MBC6450871.1 hypothetical protein [Actinokineospora xionganensis]